MVRREVAKVLKYTHAQELSLTPKNEWPQMMRHQQEEIQAVASGKLEQPIDRRSWAYPYLPEALHRLNQPLLKNTPYNLRRFSETPIPRRAINLIKNAVLSLAWKVVVVDEVTGDDPERELRIRIATEALKRPNNSDSFRDLLEAVLEDHIIGGYACIEPRLTPYYQRPIKMWPVDGSTVRIFMDWTESTPDRPRYAQMTGLKGERGIVTFLDDELIYIRDNVRTNTPFGLGKLEVAFNTVNAFLGAQDMAARAGADQVHKTWLWWEQAINPAHIQTVRRHLINELEGQAKISLLAGAKKPEVISVEAVRPEDLLLDWQEFTIRIIANAFDLSPQSLGLERDVNRNTAMVMAISDWRNAVVPVAKRFEEALTRSILQRLLGWKDLQFQFIGLDDPDPMIQVQIQRMKYMMNALTPDEIREDDDRPPLLGGFGRLTMQQMQALIMARMAQLGGGTKGGAAAMGGSMGSAMGKSFGTSGMDTGGGMGGGSMRFAAAEVAQMTPDEIQMYQELGLMPPTPQLEQQMEEEQPGILEMLSDELRQFFDRERELEEQSEVQPAPITPAMQEYQEKKFADEGHKESIAEQVINRRGVFGPPLDQSDRKAPQRGKYPRGPNLAPETLERRNGKSTLPKKHYRPGKGNKYQ